MRRLLLLILAIGGVLYLTPLADAQTTAEVPSDTTATPLTSSAEPDYRPTKRRSYAATILVGAAIYQRPANGRRTGLIQPWISSTGNPTVLLVLERSVDKNGIAWLKVLLPKRPNGATGWLREDQTLVRENPIRVVISRSAHMLYVYKNNRVILKRGVAVGKPSTPTPLGSFAIYQKIREAYWSPLGPWALHLTAHSNVLFEYKGGPGRVAIHGARGELWAEAGTNVSNGCIRVPDPGIRKVVALVTVGTPVTIVR